MLSLGARFFSLGGIMVLGPGSCHGAAVSPPGPSAASVPGGFPAGTPQGITVGQGLPALPPGDSQHPGGVRPSRGL